MHIVMVIFAALLAFVLAWWITRSLCSPKSFLSIFAHPNDRTLHSTPTPQTGGLAIVTSVVISLIVAAGVLIMTEPSKAVFPKGVMASGSVWIVLSMLLIFTVSFIDDCIGLPASLRLGVQAVASLIIVVGVGLTLDAVPIPGWANILLGVVSIPVSVLILMWMANLYNFMDGMDGFAGGMTFFGFGFLTYFGWHAHFPVMVIIASFVSMGALGFLVHNFPPARIFMGDAGSITVGFLAGTLMILGVRDRIFSLWVPIIIFSPFIVDATVTLIRRACHRKKIWEAHREHYYQRLVLSGWSHRRAVLAEYGVMITCGGLAILYHHSPEAWRLIILGTWVMMFLVLGRLVSRSERQARRAYPARDPRAASKEKPVVSVSAPSPERETIKA